MEISEGKLEFFGWWHRPWLIKAKDDEKIDIWPRFENVLKNLNGKSAKMKLDGSSISFEQDDASGLLLEFKSDAVDFFAIIRQKEGFGFSNIIAYVGDVMQAINGRQVIVETTNNSFSIKADPTEWVFGLYYTRDNSCLISNNEAMKICLIGNGADSCAFAVVTGDGFECQKFNPPTARMILNRLADGTFNAKRIGNCALLGRV